MKKQNFGPRARTAPVDNVASIFTARRDLRQAVKYLVRGTGLSLEDADILLFLYGIRELGWTDCPSDHGFISLSDLKSVIVYDASLLSRRIKGLASMVALRKGKAADSKLHPKSLQVRIEDAGIVAIRPIWENYCKFSKELLAGFTKAELDAHYKVNEGISRELKTRRDPASYLLTPST